MKLTDRQWLIWFSILTFITLISAVVLVYIVDPLFHYHRPVSAIYYSLDSHDERAQNNGIIKHFEYNGMIIGTSMTENFMTSEAEYYFGGEWIKTPFRGASYKEIDNNIKLAISSNASLIHVIRGLDMSYFFMDLYWPGAVEVIGDPPDYLYDDDLFNDVKYVFNRDTMFGKTIPMCIDYIRGSTGG